MVVIDSIFWLLVALLILVTLHEYGHYWVARKCGVGIRRFSVGFGKPIWMKTAADGTEYALAMIPLGGYVRMIDEREGAVKPSELPFAFNRKPVMQRIAIVAAGPLINLAFAVFAFWLMFMVGVQEFRMVLGEPTGIAAESGLVKDDEIIAVNGVAVETVTHANIELIAYAIDREDVSVTVERPDGSSAERTLLLSQLPDEFREEEFLSTAGMVLFQSRPIIAELPDDSPARRAGIQPGDLVTAINGSPVTTFSQMRDAIQQYQSIDDPIVVEVDRDGYRTQMSLVPDIVGEDDQRRRLIGVSTYDPASQRFVTVFQYSALDAVPKAFSELWRMTTGTFALIKRMITGDASLRNVSGVITIADFARQSADLGFSRFLAFLAMLSLSLGILNLLPIPLLDGGHLLYYFVELVKGSPVSEKVQIAGQYVGLLVIGALLILTFHNDILRLMS